MVYWISQDDDGWLGPRLLRDFHPDSNKTPRWAHNVLFRALWAEYQMGCDRDIIGCFEEILSGR